MKSNNDFNEAPHKESSFWKRFLLVTICLVIGSLVGGIYWIRYQGELRQQKLTAHAEMRYIDVQRQDVKLFALPLAWSVRKELIRFNYDQIEEYFNELVKRKGFSIIMLIDPSGNIKVSTDRKLQGSSFALSYPGINIKTSELVAYPVQKGKNMFLVPVMGLNEKIGTVAFIYNYQELSLP